MQKIQFSRMFFFFFIVIGHFESRYQSVYGEKKKKCVVVHFKTKGHLVPSVISHRFDTDWRLVFIIYWCPLVVVAFVFMYISLLSRYYLHHFVFADCFRLATGQYKLKESDFSTVRFILQTNLHSMRNTLCYH